LEIFLSSPNNTDAYQNVLSSRKKQWQEQEVNKYKIIFKSVDTLKEKYSDF
jgi:hypothetical protein